MKERNEITENDIMQIIGRLFILAILLLVALIACIAIGFIFNAGIGFACFAVAMLILSLPLIKALRSVLKKKAK